jgi:MFS-type transporter involved in bile tolerance (Atg22 family)
VLRPLTLVFAASSIAFIAAAQARAALWLLLVTGALAGASMPGLGSMVRARWSTLLAGSGRMHTAFALESVIDEMIFIVGPALVTLLATEVRPAAGTRSAVPSAASGTDRGPGGRRWSAGLPSPSA